MSKYNIDLDYVILGVDISYKELEEIKNEADKIISENNESHEILAVAYLKKAQCRRKLESCKIGGFLFYDDYGMAGFLFEWDKIKELLKKALELSPNMPDALMQLGLCSGNHDKYREYISRAIQLKPDYAAAYNNRAMIYYDPTDNNLEYLTNEEHQDVEKINKLKNNFRNAIADITEAIKLRPNDALYHLNRGVFHSRLGEHKEAIDDFYKAINYASDVLMDKLKTVVVIFKLLGKEYLELNDYTKAIGNFTEILCNMPDFEKIIASEDTLLKQNFYETLRMRGKAYFLAGEKMKAKADFGEYLKRKREETAAVTRNSIFKLIGVMPEDI